jgi:hypothetical protein
MGGREVGRAVSLFCVVLITTVAFSVALICCYAQFFCSPPHF